MSNNDDRAKTVCGWVNCFANGASRERLVWRARIRFVGYFGRVGGVCASASSEALGSLFGGRREELGKECELLKVLDERSACGKP